MRKESFARNFLGGMVSLLSLSIIPVSYPKEYRVVTKVYDARGLLIKEYHRSGTLEEWVNIAMIFYYP